MNLTFGFQQLSEHLVGRMKEETEKETRRENTGRTRGRGNPGMDGSRRRKMREEVDGWREGDPNLELLRKVCACLFTLHEGV
jgi:hypothetical protein